MIEAGAVSAPTSREILIDALRLAQREIQPLLETQRKLVEDLDAVENRATSLSSPERLLELREAAELLCGADFLAVYADDTHTKLSRKAAIAEVRENAKRILFHQSQNRAETAWAMDAVERDIMARAIISSSSGEEQEDSSAVNKVKGPRCDGRHVNEVRSL